MKRIILVCGIVLVSAAAAVAQSVSSHPAPPVVSKTEFTAKVAELNTLMAAGNTAAANAKFNEISQLINAELTVLRYKMQDATDAHNAAENTHYMNMSKAQRGLYAQALQLKSDMAANKAAINEKLTAFADAII